MPTYHEKVTTWSPLDEFLAAWKKTEAVVIEIESRN